MRSRGISVMKKQLPAGYIEYPLAETLTLSLVPESFTLHGKACSFGALQHAEALQRLVG